MNRLSVTPIPSLNFSLQCHVDPLAPWLNLPIQVRNTPTSALPNIAQGGPAQALPHMESSEITDKNFLDYLRIKKFIDPQPCVFRNLTLGRGMHKDILAFLLENPDALKFNGDTFIDPSMRYCCDDDIKYEFINCTIKAEDRKLDWFKVELSGVWGKGTIIDGLYKKTVSHISTIRLVNADMREVTLKNLIFEDREFKVILDTDFSSAIFRNLMFESFFANSPYAICNVNFSHINATALGFSNVKFFKTSYSGAKINGLTLVQYVDFRGATFDGYSPGDISLSNVMFSTPRLINQALNKDTVINNKHVGAVLLNALTTLTRENNNVRIDWAEQLVAKIKTYKPLSQEYLKSDAIQISVHNELSKKCYASSSKIREFLIKN